MKRRERGSEWSKCPVGASAWDGKGFTGGLERSCLLARVSVYLSVGGSSSRFCERLKLRDYCDGKRVQPLLPLLSSDKGGRKEKEGRKTRQSHSLSLYLLLLLLLLRSSVTHSLTLPVTRLLLPKQEKSRRVARHDC